MRGHVHHGYVVSRKFLRLRVTRTPWHLFAIEWVADKLCAVSGHRLCVKLFSHVDVFVDRRSTSVEIDVTREELERWCAYFDMKPPTWSVWFNEEA